MAMDPVATAASNNPVLSSLVTLVGEAGLVDTLNSAEDITVFAPANDAIAGLPKKTASAAMADPKGLLTEVLTYHVVPGRLAPEDLAGMHETLQGTTLEVSGSGEDFMVNGDAGVDLRQRADLQRHGLHHRRGAPAEDVTRFHGSTHHRLCVSPSTPEPPRRPEAPASGRRHSQDVRA